MAAEGGPVVFMLDGFGWSNVMPLMKATQELRGSRLVQVTYNNKVGNSLAAVSEAVEILDSHLRDPQYAGVEKVVCAISMGAQVAYKWIRDKSDSCGLASDELSFVLLGNPENRVGGVAHFAPKWFGGGYGGCGIAADVRFKVTNLSRRYDGVADYPNGAFPSFWAVSNAMAGVALVHSFYFWSSLSDPRNLSLSEGNVTYVLAPTDPVQAVLERSYDRSMFKKAC